ncbi:hypothetical protein EVB61_154 [Rhizobium phage RHph_TM21B]|nr:hypothetical protein EVB61_154 [Rhizobium phage RHph_TM21B]
MRYKFEHQSVIPASDFDPDGLDIVWIDDTYASADSLDTISKYMCCEVNEIQQYTSVEEI